MVRPVVLVSKCLEFEPVRYDGQVIPSKIVRDLIPFVDFITVCPEHAIGLGVPRQPIRIVKIDGEERLIQHNTHIDLTEKMNTFCTQFLSNRDTMDGFIFKSGSPSMGARNIKVYSGMKGSPVVSKRDGFFTQQVKEKFSGYPIEEENRLKNRKIRDHFLTQVWLFARYRHAHQTQSLKRFHEENTLLFEFYDREASKNLNPDSADYFEQIKNILVRPPTSEHIYVFFKGHGIETSILEQYSANKMSFETLKALAKRHMDEKQTFFTPYPDPLLLDVDTDRDRDFWREHTRARGSECLR